MSTGWALVVSALLLAGNGFFVAAEFALVASKRHRLEQAAAGGSRAARAALAGSRQLSLMLAGAQLGITLCSLGLGALAEPAIAHLIDPWLHAAGLPEQASYAVAFVIALAIVVFLHMVVGEMAPKSWAISDPERSALLLAVPFRGFTTLVRPLLAVLNGLANAFLRLIKVAPQDELAAAHGPDELRMLLEASRVHGTLPADQHQMLSRMLQLQNTTLARVMIPRDQIIAVGADDSAHQVEQVNLATGRSRLAVLDEDGQIVGVAHIRDALRATSADTPATAAQLMAAPFTLPADTSVLAAVRAMRDARAQLAVITDGGTAVGLAALEDLLEQVIGEFDDETDPIAPPGHPPPLSGTSPNP
ncbi:CBS domain containing-hemolysin-like protein [Krasilnikovia cinnamomea]|uniref:CBS domain containing-hemolysin-like protein n=1 Tax=Krasilnikovia cinnamomea TaxID=349313 RepID=A0A4Q7ZSV8_9ACTN|nr:hemolysin family protein [Krasilnikovia cinnamomea]RZU54290.1 CBS domain containing-hemolysin-like protein [Krasilnikovia cinnamomea]